MESLLSLAFDNLSSYDTTKIRKGLRQVEGLLAQLCLAPANPARHQQHRPSTPRQDDSSDSSASSNSPARSLPVLSDDPAFREFFKLQEGFEWNVALRLVGALDRLVARSRDGDNDLVVLSALDLMQGLMLLHPPSKSLFAREQHMNLLLDLLEPAHCPAIQSATLLTLVAALIDVPTNTRTFEALDGLLTITSLFRSRSTSRDVKLKLVEFLYFYLMPETPAIPTRTPPSGVPVISQHSPSKASSVFGGDARDRRRGSVDDGGNALTKTRTTEEKQVILGRHLSNVEDLVRDLATSAPFGGAVH